jgi:hypothetical protein
LKYLARKERREHIEKVSERQTMQIRGLVFPSQFVRFIQSGSLRRDQGSWPLRDGRDAYGNPCEAELGEVYKTIGTIQRESDLLPRHFPPEFANFPDEFVSEPRFIPYITDFGQILAFGIAGDGAPFCFDYRGATVEPSIIWWDDAFWRRIAPSFASFTTLFDLERSA